MMPGIHRHPSDAEEAIAATSHLIGDEPKTPVRGDDDVKHAPVECRIDGVFEVRVPVDVFDGRVKCDFVRAAVKNCHRESSPVQAIDDVWTGRACTADDESPHESPLCRRAVPLLQISGRGRVAALTDL
jgi:hypothetical protein